MLKTEDSYLLKQSSPGTAFPTGVAEAKKMAFFHTDFDKFKERTIWHSAFNSRKLLSDAGGSL